MGQNSLYLITDPHCTNFQNFCEVCNVAPIPGETKVWQFVSLTKKVFLIDCPGVVYSGEKHDETELVLRGVCRVENIQEPSNHISEVLKRAEHNHLARLYQVTGWEQERFLILTFIINIKCPW